MNTRTGKINNPLKPGEMRHENVRPRSRSEPPSSMNHDLRCASLAARFSLSHKIATSGGRPLAREKHLGVSAHTWSITIVVEAQYANPGHGINMTYFLSFRILVSEFKSEEHGWKRLCAISMFCVNLTHCCPVSKCCSSIFPY